MPPSEPPLAGSPTVPVLNFLATPPWHPHPDRAQDISDQKSEVKFYEPTSSSVIITTNLKVIGVTLMYSNETRVYEVLAQIAEAANEILGESTCAKNHGHAGSEEAGEPLSCIPKVLPARLLIKAAETARNFNPVNAPGVTAFVNAGEDFQAVEPAARIAVATTKYWGARPRTLTVSFMETTPADLRTRIISHMNAWTKTGGVSFTWTSGTGQVRISRGGGGYYSYLGTDVLHIPTNRQTMNLQGFTMNTPETEYKRVIRHETGHTLGCPHEHMRRSLVARIDPEKAYEYFLRTQGWDKGMVDAQVLTSLNEASLMATPPDQTSIMCYQLPGSITRDGRPITGGLDINATDYAFIGKIYPKVGAALARSEAMAEGGPTAASADEWDESEDVEVDADVYE